MKYKLLSLAKMVPLVWALSACAEDILDHWYFRDPRALTKIRFLNGQFVGVGTNGTILTSPNGKLWTARTSGTTNNLRAVTWGSSQPFFNSLFVAVGDAATILISSNAINWTLIPSAYSCDLTDASFSWPNFIAATVAGSTNIPNFLLSQQGTSWSGAFVPWMPGYGNGYRMDALAAGPIPLIAAGGTEFADDIWRSWDGYSWDKVGFSDQIVNGIAYANGRFLMIGWEGPPIVSTNNGDSWFFSSDTNVCNPPPGQFCYVGQDITFGATSFVVVRSYLRNGLLTTADGLNWTNRSGLTGLEIDTIAFGNGYYVAAGDNGIYRAEVAAPVLDAQLLAGSNAIQLAISGEVERAYRLQGSTNFSSWSDVWSFTNNGPPSKFVEPIDKSLPGRFYRVVSP